MTRTRDAAVYMSGLLFQQAIAFLLGVATARLIGPHGYGQVSLARAVYGFAAILAPLGLDLSLLRRLGELRDRPCAAGAEVRTLRRVAIVANVAVAGAAAAWIGPWLQGHVFHQPGFAQDLALAFAALPFAADLAISTAVCRASDRVVLSSLLTLYLQPLARGAVLAALLAMGAGASGVLAATSVGVALAATALRWALRTAGARARGARLREVAPLLGYSGWMAAMLLTYGALKVADVLVLGAARGAAEVGTYAALAGIAQLIGLYPAALSQTLGPRVAALHATGDRAAMRGELARYVRTASLICAPPFAVLTVFAPWLALLFGARFHFSGALALPLALGAYVGGVFGPMAVSLSMTGRHRLEFAILLGGALGSLAGALLLARPFGGVGVAWAMLGGYLWINGARSAVSARIMGGFDMGRLELALPLACLGMAALAKAAAGLAGAPSAGVMAAVLLALGLAYAVLYLKALLTPEEQAALAALTRRRTRLTAAGAPCRS